MATIRSKRGENRTMQQTFGLLANGAAGSWEVAVDEAVSGLHRWFLEFSGPSVDLRFEIASPKIIERLLQFLQSTSATPKSQKNGRPVPRSILSLTKRKGTTVSVFRDDEYKDRVIFAVGPTTSPLVRYSLDGSDLKNVYAALKQVAEDLREQQ
jgi:hypothetical protein